MIRQKFMVILLMMISSIAVWAQSSSQSKMKAAEVKADTLLNQQDFEGARKLYTKILASKPADKGLLLYKRAICFYSLGQYAEALTDLNTFIPETPNFPQAKLLRAFVNRELEDAEAQLTDINELLTLDPMNLEWQQWKAGLLMETGAYREARQLLVGLATLNPSEQLELYVGLSYYYEGNPDSALIHFDKSISMNGGYLPAYTYAAAICVEEGAYDLALTYVNLGLRLEPGNVDLMLYKGIALVEKDDLDRGCSCLNYAFYRGADDAEGYLMEYCYPLED
jgi:tetratricopeptide (TPR) repeat protein